MLTQGHSVIKSSELIQCLGFTDRYRLLLSHGGEFRVHIERREAYGAVSEAYLYEGVDLDAANRVFDRYSK